MQKTGESYDQVPKIHIKNLLVAKVPEVMRYHWFLLKSALLGKKKKDG